MIKVLFFVPYPSEGQSNRLRVEQYLPYLRSHGIRFSVRPFASRGFYKILYKEGFLFSKIFYFIRGSLNRILDLARVFRYDIIFIHREMYPIGPALFEYIVAKIKKPIIFDFDDAIYLPNVSKHNSFMERFKVPSKIFKIISLSSTVIAGNRYLRDFALKFNPNVTIIPTPIDTDIFKPAPKLKTNDKEIIIGWIGSPTTVAFLHLVEEAVIALSSKYSHLKFKIIGGDFHINGLDSIINKPWTLAGEIEDLNTFDIGILPMPDNEWTKGKTTFKGILYMSMGIPTVSSAVGVNKELINDGENGFLAYSIDDWINKLSMLIENSQLRSQIGMQGRKTIEENYSLKIYAPKFLDTLTAASK